MFRFWRSSALVLAFAASTPLLAQDEACDVPCDVCEPSPFAGCFDCDGFCSQPTLTGDWFGLRSSLKESGLTFAGRSTHFAFGVDGGINAPFVPPPFGQGDDFSYTGRGEYDLIVDLEKFGGSTGTESTATSRSRPARSRRPCFLQFCLQPPTRPVGST